jgi:CDP-diglyceride synthetase
MDDVKMWYKSKTVWGALIAILASVLQAAGVELGLDDQNQLADAAVTLAGALGGLLALYGRLSASSVIATR